MHHVKNEVHATYNMKLTGHVYTTNAKVFNKSIDKIKQRIELAKGITFDNLIVVEIKLPKDTQTKKDGIANRIDFDWMNQTYRTDGNILCLHISKKEHDRLKLKHPDGGSIGGSFNRELKDTVIDFFIVGDTVSKIVQKFTHELGHGISHWLSIKDKTHHYDYDLKDLDALYKTFDATRWNQLVTLRDLLQRLVISILTKPLLPVPYKGITQAYGNYNPTLYPATGYHWGLDLRATFGTQVKAPLDGEVLESTYSKGLGYYIQFFDGKHYHIIPHLKGVTPLGKYKRGDVIGLIGGTGTMTAVHCHLEIWNERMTNRVQQLKDNGWEITIDPAKYYKL